MATPNSLRAFCVLAWLTVPCSAAAAQPDAGEVQMNSSTLMFGDGKAMRVARWVLNHHGAVLIDALQYRANVEKAVAALRCADERSLDMHVLAVMKADAYGHGVRQLAPQAEKGGASYIGIVDSWEAEAARDAGWRGGILRLRGAHITEVRAHAPVGIEEWIGSAGAAADLDAFAKKSANGPMPVHFSLSFWMNRNNFQSAHAAVQAAKASPNLCVVGVLAHMPTADGNPDATLVYIQKFFAAVLEALPGIVEHRQTQPESCRTRKVIIHWANSATTIRFGNDHPVYLAFRNELEQRGLLQHVGFMVRVGGLLYGHNAVDWSAGPPFALGQLDGFVMPPPEGATEGNQPSMKATMSFLSWGAVVRTMNENGFTQVGYGGTKLNSYVEGEDVRTTLATLPVGWADGLYRGESNFGLLETHARRLQRKARQGAAPTFSTETATAFVAGEADGKAGRTIMVGEDRAGTAFIAGKLSMDMAGVDISGLVDTNMTIDGSSHDLFVFMGHGGGVKEITPDDLGPASEVTINIGRKTSSNPDILRLYSADEILESTAPVAEGITAAAAWRFFQAALAPADVDEPLRSERQVVWKAIKALSGGGASALDNEESRPLDSHMRFGEQQAQSEDIDFAADDDITRPADQYQWQNPSARSAAVQPRRTKENPGAETALAATARGTVQSGALVAFLAVSFAFSFVAQVVVEAAFSLRRRAQRPLLSDVASV